MTTNHKPATALPWTTGQMPARWPEHDRMYAAFAANAYPKLVEALAEIWASIPSTYDEADIAVKRHSTALNAISALLRELGEAA